MSCEKRPRIHFQPDGIHVPPEVASLTAFRRWAQSDTFPERGRIDWLEGDIEIDVSPEDLNTHGTAKVAIARTLHGLIEDNDRGVVLVDSSRISVPHADLSAEPDVVVLLFETVERGATRLVPKAGGFEDRFVEIEGPPDLVVECVSDSSEAKDRRRLFDRYRRAGIREYWLVDARSASPALEIFRLEAGTYIASPSEPDGFIQSPLLGVHVRLIRLPERAGLVRHRLEVRPH